MLLRRRHHRCCEAVEKYLNIRKNSSLDRQPFPSTSYMVNISLDFSCGDPGRVKDWKEKQTSPHQRAPVSSDSSSPHLETVASEGPARARPAFSPERTHRVEEGTSGTPGRYWDAVPDRWSGALVLPGISQR